MAHTLKGVAGNIGATQVHELADQMNAAVRQKGSRDEMEQLCGVMSRELSMLVATLQSILP